MRSISVLVSLLFAGLFALSAIPTQANAPTSCRPGDVFESDDVRIWFHGSKGFVKVFETNATTGETSHFDYTTGEIVELTDGNDTLARMNLERAFPQTSGCTIEETEEFVNMSITVTDDVNAAGGSVGDATVTFAYHFNKTSHGAKFDLLVNDWPWQGDGELAYAFGVHTSDGALVPAENGLGWQDDEGNAKGYVEWDANATAYYEDGHNETAVVDSDTTMSGDQNARVELRFTQASAGYNELVYDPWVGTGLWIIVGVVLIGLAPAQDGLELAIGALNGLL